MTDVDENLIHESAAQDHGQTIPSRDGLIERLRATREFFEQPPSSNMKPPPSGSFYGLLTEAADTIERLKQALEPFADAANDTDGYPDDHPIGCDPQIELAIRIEDGAFGPLKVIHLRSALRARETQP